MWAIALYLFVASANVEAVKVNCEKIERFSEYKNACYLNESSVIEANKVTFTGPDKSEINAILFDDNKRIRFLPVNIYKKFPNLEFFSSRNTSVKEISALNFKFLASLKVLNLQENQIEFIPDYCFDGLTRLNEIYLSNQ